MACYLEPYHYYLDLASVRLVVHDLTCPPWQNHYCLQMFYSVYFHVYELIVYYKNSHYLQSRSGLTCIHIPILYEKSFISFMPKCLSSLIWIVDLVEDEICRY